MDPVICTPLKVVPHPKGNIFHALRKDDAAYCGFGEAYFSLILHDEVKGWKKHSRMTLNLVVPVGLARFYISHDLTRVDTYDIGTDHYARLTIPPGYWVAFKGLSTGINLVLNVASIPHDPLEAENLPLETLPIR